MSQVKITPELLAEIEARANATTKTGGMWESVRKFVMDENNEYLFETPYNELSAWAAATNPATVLAMIERIERLEAANQEMLKALEDYLAAQSPEDVFEAVSQAHDVVAKAKGESNE